MACIVMSIQVLCTCKCKCSLCHRLTIYRVMAYRGMACIVLAYGSTADTNMPYIVMAYIDMAYIVMAHMVMAYIVMAHDERCRCHRPKTERRPVAPPISAAELWPKQLWRRE